MFVPPDPISNDHQPFEAGMPTSMKRPSFCGPSPPAPTLLQPGLNRNSTVPLRRLILALPFASTSRYIKTTPLVLSRIAPLVHKSVTPTTLLTTNGNWPPLPIQLFVLSNVTCSNSVC